MSLDKLEINNLLDTLEASLRQTVAQRGLANPLMVGIRTGGVWVAEELHRRLGIAAPVGLLDISFYRDDFSQIGMYPNVKPSQLPPNIEGRDIILVDDVFYTGRTARAALNEIFDYGRPRQVVLAVLIERLGKQIPISPDCVGRNIALSPEQRVKLSYPPLAIQIESQGRP